MALQQPQEASPRSSLSRDDFLASLESTPTPKPKPMGRSREEFLDFVGQLYPEESTSAAGQFLGGLGGTLADIAEFPGFVERFAPAPQMFSEPLPTPDMAAAAESMRGGAQAVYPESVRGTGGLQELTLTGLGGTAPLMAAGVVGGPAAMAATGAAQGASDMYWSVLDATGDETKAMQGGLAGLGLGALEVAGLGPAAARLDKASGGAIKRLLLTLGREAGQEALQAGLQGKVFESLTGEDVDLWTQMAQGAEGGAAVASAFLTLTGVPLVTARRLLRGRQGAPAPATEQPNTGVVGEEVAAPQAVAPEQAGAVAGTETGVGAPESEAAAPAPTSQTVRFYHGGQVGGGGPRWLTQDQEYAKNYREGGTLQYVDVPVAELERLGVKKAFDDEGTTVQAPYVHWEAPESIAAGLKPVETPGIAQEAPTPEMAPAAPVGPAPPTEAPRAPGEDWRPPPVAQEGPFEAEMLHGTDVRGLKEIAGGRPARHGKEGMASLGAFFTPRPDDAQRYSRARKSGQGVEYGPKGSLYRQKVRLEKPLYMSWADYYDGLLMNDAAAAETRARLEAQGHDGIVVKNPDGSVVEVVSFKSVPVGKEEPGADVSDAVMEKARKDPRWNEIQEALHNAPPSAVAAATRRLDALIEEARQEVLAAEPASKPSAAKVEEAPPKRLVEMMAGPPSPLGASKPISPTKVKSAIKRWFTSAGHAPKEARRAIEGISGFQRAEVIEASRDARQIDKAMRKAHGGGWQATPAARLVDDAFEGDQKALSQLTPEAQDGVGKMRAHLDRLIRLQVKEGGVIDPTKAPEFAKKILGSQGRYATRAFKANIDPEWADKVEPDVRQRLLTLWSSWAQPIDEAQRKALRKASLQRTPEAKSALAQRRALNKEIDLLAPQARAGDQAAKAKIRELRQQRRGLKPKVSERTPEGQKARRELIGRKQFEGMSTADIEAQMDAILQAAKENAESPWKTLAAGKLGRKDLSIYKKRKDIPEELLAFLGEIKDPIANYANSVMKIAGVIAKHEAYTTIRQQGLGKWLFEPGKSRPREFSAKLSAEGNKGLLPLDGLYTTPDIKKALSEITPKDTGLLMQAAMRVNSAIKWGKVIGQPWSFMRNLQSNVGLVVANGHMPTFFRSKEWKTAFGVGDLAEQKRLTRLGVVGSGISTTEWQDLRASLALSPEELVRGPKSAFGKAKAGAERAYEAADNAPKIRFFYAEEAHLKRAGYSPKRAEEIAAERTRDLMPTTERMPEALKALRRQPLIGSFFSFQAEILRTTANRLRLIAQEIKSPNDVERAMGYRRAAGQLLAASATPALVYGINSLNGIDADEDRDKKEFVPPWDKGSYLIWFGEEAKGQYLDPSDVDPFSLFTAPLASVLGGEDPEKALERWAKDEGDTFFGPSPVADLAIEIITGKTMTGAPIDDAAAHVIKRVEPGFVSAAKRAGEQGVGGEAASIVSGYRRYDFDVEKSLGYDVRRFAAEISNATSKKRRQEKKVPADAAEFTSEMEGTRQELFEEMSAKAQAAIRLGVPERTVRKILDESLSADVTRAVLRGAYIPHRESRARS